MAKGTGTRPGFPFLGAKQKRRATWSHYAEIVPQVNPVVEVDTSQPHAIILLVPVQAAAPWFKFVMSKSSTSSLRRKIELDAVGSFVWRLIDGKSTLETLRGALAAEFKMKQLESQVAIAAFIDELFSRGLVLKVAPR